MNETRETSATAVPLDEIARQFTVSVARTINSSLDAVFYDLGALTSEEQSALSAYSNPEGSVIIVHPGESKQRIDCFMPWKFVEQQRDASGCQVDALVVAGVGSSALGTAALARNVADYLRRPVAGVVSGFGMSDLLSEALGGWFVLGAKNALRDGLARLFDLYGVKDHVRDERSHVEMKQHFESSAIDTDRFVYGSPDSATLLYVLSKLGNGIKLVVGHSKGNLSIENALEGLLAANRKTGAPVPSHLCIVTLGAVTRFPSEFTNVHQFLGSIDYFGMMYSRPFLPREWAPYNWHSLNTALPGHLTVHDALQKAAVR
jgi:hypothetical protein